MKRKLFIMGLSALVVLLFSSCVLLPNGDILWFVPIPVYSEPDYYDCPDCYDHYRHHSPHPEGHRPPPPSRPRY